MRGGVEHFGISECRGGGKISMPPVVGVRVFFGTTHSRKPQSCPLNVFCSRWLVRVHYLLILM